MMFRSINRNLFFRLLSIGFFTGCLLCSSVFAFAQDPTAAVITKVKGNRISIRRGTQKETESVKPNKSALRRELDTLYVGADKYSMAGLQFIVEKQMYGGMLVETIPQAFESAYKFPCRGKGSMTIAWAKGGKERACNEGVHIEVISRKSNQKKRAQTIIEEANNKALTAQSISSDELLIQPGEDHTIIQVLNTEDATEILVVLGKVSISPTTGNRVDLQAGQKYSYPSKQISSFDRNSIVQAEDFKKFLDPDSWVSSSSSNQALQTDLEEKQIALGLKEPNPVLSSIAQEILDAHNQCRSRVGVPPLKWSSQVAAYAQSWADTLSKTGKFEHRPGGRSGFGENLAGGTGNMSPTDMVNMWCNEQSKYDPQAGRCRGSDPMSCYHFTQVVWSRTTELGCGLASHPEWGKVIVCNYNPPGNYSGERPY